MKDEKPNQPPDHLSRLREKLLLQDEGEGFTETGSLPQVPLPEIRASEGDPDVPSGSSEGAYTREVNPSDNLIRAALRAQYLRLSLTDTINLAHSLKKLNPSRELSLMITKLEEAEMWLGKHLNNNPGR